MILLSIAVDLAYFDDCIGCTGFKKVNDITDVILTVLKSNGGFMPVNDKTAPDEIYSLFGVSKKTFKKALGVLYKEKRIFITNEGIKSTE